MLRLLYVIPCILILTVIAFSPTPVFSQDDVTAVQDSAFKERMRPRVAFYHEDHNEKAQIEDCGICHHVYEDGERLEDETSEDMECSHCHLKPKEKAVFTLVKIYHQQCRGCHIEQKKGPIMCSQCHVKD